MTSSAASLRAWFFACGDASAAAAVRLGFGACYLFMLWDLYPVRDLLLGHGGFFGTFDPRYVPTGFADLLYRFDSPIDTRIWFGAATLCALLVLVGLFTRWAVPVSMLCLLLIHRRNPYMLFGADMVLFNIGLWLMFLKCDRAWSVDRWLRLRLSGAAPRTIPLWPLRVIQIQMALVYFRSAMAKLATEPWQEGTAVYYALHALGNHAAPELLENKLLLTLLTYGTVAIEFAFPFLVFWRPTRWVGILSAAMLHLGIDLLMAIRFFGPVMYAGLLSFVLPEEWTRLETTVRRWSRKASPPASGSRAPLEPAASTSGRAAHR